MIKMTKNYHLKLIQRTSVRHGYPDLETWIGLEQWFVRDETIFKNTPLLTTEALSSNELEGYIDELIQELEIIRKKARRLYARRGFTPDGRMKKPAVTA